MDCRNLCNNMQLTSQELKYAFIFHFCLIRLISAGINRPIMNIEGVLIGWRWNLQAVDAE